MYARGYEFAEITFGKSQGTKFCVADGEVVPPFMAVSGIGETAAGNLHDEYERKPFETVEELLERVKISKKNVDSLKKFGNLKDIPESAQMTMF